jgi:polyisoprenyl-teichoic acid--peptidoglycan teichoic acid transferase
LSERDGTPEGTEGEGRDEDAAAEPTVPDAPAEHTIPDAPQPATWAGRRAQEPEPEAEEVEQEEPEAEQAEPEEPEAEQAEPEAEEPEAEEPADADDEPEPAEEPEEESRGDTAEEDTVALADREQAQEAAMAGLRERAATEAARRKVSPATPTGAHPVAPAAEPKAEAAPPAAAVPAAPADVGTGPSRWGLWARFVSASFLIVASMATATAVSALVYLSDFANALNPIPGLGKDLFAVEGGKPETILILGSDRRTGETDKGRSDTTILLRIDPDQEAIRLLSIPRDLKVNIPGYGIDKLNAAYNIGGPDKTLQTVKGLTGIEINHVVNIDFLGFADAVNAIGCVYIDVDRHYYIPPDTGVAEIDILAGYQRLCGLKALQYVRYRHTDNDLVRAARQQGFLQQARAQVPTSKLINPFSDERRKLVDIFTKYTSSDIKDTATVIDMLKLFIEARSAEVKEIQFPADIGGPTSLYVTARQKDIQAVVRQFLGETGTPESPSQQPSGGGEPKKKPEGGGAPTPPAPPPMTDATDSGAQYAAAVYDPQLTKFPIYYPTKIPPGSSYSDESRSFKIDGPGNDVYYGYKFVLSHFTAYYNYYGASGTDWKDPPILANPSETKTIDGRDYLLFWDGDRLRQVGFKTQKGSYWVTNDLLETLEPGQMLAMAESMREYQH